MLINFSHLRLLWSNCLISLSLALSLFTLFLHTQKCAKWYLKLVYVYKIQIGTIVELSLLPTTTHPISIKYEITIISAEISRSLFQSPLLVSPFRLFKFFLDGDKQQKFSKSVHIQYVYPQHFQNISCIHNPHICPTTLFVSSFANVLLLEALWKWGCYAFEQRRNKLTNALIMSFFY